jgi:hypothetical protein
VSFTSSPDFALDEENLIDCSMACAIREAYAACLNVVILIDKFDDEDLA